MAESLASFRELQGVGPATEARLHQAGIHSWRALSDVLAALGGMRSRGREPLRALAERAAARAAEEGDAPGGERFEAFIVRLALDADGAPLRTSVTHVRSQAEHMTVGWIPDEAARFVEDCLRVRRPGADPPQRAESRSPRSAPGDAVPAPVLTLQPGAADAAAPAVAVRDHVIDLDLGRMLGGTGRGVELDAHQATGSTAWRSCRATLLRRAYGLPGSDAGWAAAQVRTGHIGPDGRILLRFDDVVLPAGLHRLRIRVAVGLSAPDPRPPVLAVDSVRVTTP